ncbi:MAG: secondary thiamine-phosphate synthase enzyme YjbQ [Lentisphaerota bacterium]
MKELKVVTKRRTEMLDITAEVNRLIPSFMDSGVCHVFCNHTTAGLTVNENADPDVQRDILGALERLIPWDDPAYRHGEGNSAAHLKASMLGFSQMLPFGKGRLCMGIWQGIYLCEFDGPRTRTVTVQFLKEQSLS